MKRGFTLIEIVIALAIFVVIGSIGLFLGMDQYRGYMLNSDRDTAVALIQKARNLSLNNINEAKHGFYISPSSFIVFQGNSYGTRDASHDESVPRSATVTVSGVQEVVFNQLRGDVSTGTGDITLSNNIKTFTISINSEGRVNW